MWNLSHISWLCALPPPQATLPSRLHNPIVQNFHLPTRIAIKEMTKTIMTRTPVTITGMGDIDSDDDDGNDTVIDNNNNDDDEGK